MIVSASRRTDLPHWHMDWFLNRLREEYALVRNPVNPRQISHVPLRAPELDGIVFWSKYPASLLGALDALADIPFYIQATVNPYGREVEPGLPALDERIEVFRALARRLGPCRLIWRYDPILLSGRYDEAFHRAAFETIAAALEGSAERAVVSFVDSYRKIEKNLRALGVSLPGEEQMRTLAGRLCEIAHRHGFLLEACAEATDLTGVGVTRGKCIDAALLSRIAGREIPRGRPNGGRAACGCDASVDIGAYDTCKNGCRYCYASFGRLEPLPCPADLPLLGSTLGPLDRVTRRREKDLQMRWEL